jgi:hypothetical protein
MSRDRITHLETNDSDLVDGVETAYIVRRGEDSDGHEPVGVDVGRDERVVERELVGCECTGLVRAKDVHSCKRLDRREFLYDGLSSCEVCRTDGKRRGGDDWETDRHADDEEDKGVDEEVVLRWRRDLDSAEEGTDPDHEDEEDDEHEETRTDSAEDDLEVALLVRVGDELGGAPHERLFGSAGDHGVALAALDATGVVRNVTDELVHSEGLARDGRLVDRAEGRALVLVLVVILVVVVVVMTFLLIGGAARLFLPGLLEDLLGLERERRRERVGGLRRRRRD